MTRKLYDACVALLAAPHPDHFAARLDDEELDALNAIKAEVAVIGENPVEAVLTRTENDLTFHELIMANLSRVERWHGLDDWSALEWAGAMCGEAGEAANYAKKLKRVETQIVNNDKRMLGLEVPKDQLLEVYRQGVGMECADAIIYSVLLCARAKVDLVQCIRDAFNAKSIEYGFPERL